MTMFNAKGSGLRMNLWPTTKIELHGRKFMLCAQMLYISPIR